MEPFDCAARDMLTSLLTRLHADGQPSTEIDSPDVRARKEPAIAVPTSSLREVRTSGVPDASTASSSMELCIVATIVNLHEIEHAYGETVAHSVRHIVYEQAREFSQSNNAIVAMGGAHILFFFEASSVSAPARETRETLDLTSILPQLVSALGSRLVQIEDAVVAPAVRATILRSARERFLDVVESANATTFGPRWREQYRRDMSVACALFVALDEGRLEFDLEPICVEGDAKNIQYHEALLCENKNGQRRRVGTHVAALERLGLVRKLDDWVVNSALAELRRDPALRLGCNVSAHSATLDESWSSILSQLREDRDLASRLTIEITESASFSSTTAARHFIKALQTLGCRIALDDIGDSGISLKALIELGVDFIKVDLRHLNQAEGASRQSPHLAPLIEFAKTFASSVVVEGIESEESARHALASGATCLQGHLYSRPHAPGIEE
jgi:EAL domain-containing protein (putative c-di-GMP-specific phosphodiesterase class I)